TDSDVSEPLDDKKAKIAAAVARAKAKKLAQKQAESAADTDIQSSPVQSFQEQSSQVQAPQVQVQSEIGTGTDSDVSEPLDDKKAKIAAAVARAKAKKLAQKAAESENKTDVESDDRTKADALISPAKTETSALPVTPSNVSEPVDDKKARIAAAVAKAKAKKLANKQKLSEKE
ncbi:electron transport complex subunit RsxC, partial [Shewanella sp. 10N.7]|nr:electron transport complex subunit RsxC [Shewanella sp. 10N.7]